MNATVHKQVPGPLEGVEGEIRLISVRTGTFLYVRGGGQWNILKMLSAVAPTLQGRRERGDLQRNVLKIADSNSDDTYDGGGSILTPGSGGGGSGGGSGASSCCGDRRLGRVFHNFT